MEEHCLYNKGGMCTLNAPDSILMCSGGVCNEYKPDKRVVIEGIGKDAPIEVNSAGGKQSKAPLAMHLFDANALYWLFDHTPYEDVFHCITDFMKYNKKDRLLDALFALSINKDKVPYPEEVTVDIARILKEGEEKYEANNWRLIPQEEHLNHALIHLMAYIGGDTQDDHINHFKTRLMMCFATNKSEGFDYCRYITKTS